MMIIIIAAALLLAASMAEAGPGTLVLADSDMRVGPDYLPTVLAALAHPALPAACLELAVIARPWSWARSIKPCWTGWRRKAGATPSTGWISARPPNCG
ncbi:MAG: hypothetical protein H7Z12_05240 [Rhodospirillaceae bacterium]|nr:hypothetical protein [Rhodospirillales bacterium]